MFYGFCMVLLGCSMDLISRGLLCVVFYTVSFYGALSFGCSQKAFFASDVSGFERLS